MEEGVKVGKSEKLNLFLLLWREREKPKQTYVVGKMRMVTCELESEKATLII